MVDWLGGSLAVFGWYVGWLGSVLVGWLWMCFELDLAGLGNRIGRVIGWSFGVRMVCRLAGELEFLLLDRRRCFGIAGCRPS